MAEQGASYKEILWHYYTGCEVNGEKPQPQVDHIQEAMKEVQALKAAHEVMGRRIEKIEEYLLEAERR